MNQIIIEQEQIFVPNCMIVGHNHQQIQFTCENIYCDRRNQRKMCGFCIPIHEKDKDHKERYRKDFQQLFQIIKSFKNSNQEIFDNIYIQTQIQRFINITELIESITKYKQKEETLQNILSRHSQLEEQFQKDININNYIAQIQENGIHKYLQNFKDQLIKIDNLKNDFIQNIENKENDENIVLSRLDKLINQSEIKDGKLAKHEELLQNFFNSLQTNKSNLKKELTQKKLFLNKLGDKNKSKTITILEFLMKQGYNMKSNVPFNQFQYLKDKFKKLKEQEDYLKAFSLVYSIESQNHLQESLILINKSIKKNNDPSSLYLKGIIQYDQKQYQEAVKTFEQCIKLDKQYFDAHIGLGNSQRLIGNYEEALSSYDQALLIDKYSVKAFIGKATVLKDQKKFEDAIIFYEKAIESEPQNSDAYCGIGISLHYMGKYKEAINIYETVINFDPKCVKAFINKGLAHQFLQNEINEKKEKNLQNQKEAILMFEKAIQLDPDCMAAYNHLGRALYKDKQLDRAFKIYTQILTLDSTNLDGQLGKGELLLVSGRIQDAQQVFEKVLSVYPQNEIAKRKLNYLSQVTIQN